MRSPAPRLSLLSLVWIALCCLGRPTQADDEVLDPVTQTHRASDGAFRLDLREGRAGVRFEVENLEPFPISVTLAVGVLENLRATPSLPRTLVVEGRAKALLGRLEPQDPARGWRYERVRCTYQVGAITAKPRPHTYELPYPPGRAYRIDQGFDGAFSHKGRNALDFALPEGALVTAARGGEVVKVVSEHSQGGAEERFRGRANKVWVLHADGTFGCYAHFREGGIKVRVGQIVKVGDPIGEAGATGFAQGPHLHFEVRVARSGRAKAATLAVRFRTARAPEEALALGKTYQRPEPRAAESGAKPQDSAPRPPLPSNLLGAIELCAAPTREAPAREGGRSGAKLWARLVIEAPGAYRLRISLRRRDQGDEVWSEELQLEERTDLALQPLPTTLGPGSYELRIEVEGRQVGARAFRLE